jgi:aminoglycoside phosphotransferase (APT) family kinase protein
VPEEQRLGGNLNDAVRVGDTVHRRAGPWTPSIHALLRYLERADFPAPRVVGMDAQGREVLRYIEGEVDPGGDHPVADRFMADERVTQAGKLLRRYHDVVADFRPPPNAHWRLVAPTAYELICHNDWSPWNALLRKGRLEVMLDWDLAGPGTRLWDVANAAYCWVPLGAGSSTLADVTVRARRLGAFCDAYGLEDRAELLLTMRLRIEYVARFIEEQARAGDPGFMLLRSWQTSEKMRSDVAYLDEHWITLERAL